MTQSTPDKPSRSYWVFQFVPSEDNREVETGGAGTVVPWRLAQFRESMKPGDIVFTWRASGPRSALIGWGEITGEPFSEPEEGITRIHVTTRELFKEPIVKSEFERQRELANLRIFTRGRQGTNFRLAAEQAAALIRLLQDRGLAHPEIERDTLSSSLRSRIERGVHDLASVAESIPKPEVRAQLLSAIQAVQLEEDAVASTLPEITGKLNEALAQVIQLQRSGEWTTSANVAPVILQMVEDLNQLRSLQLIVVQPSPASLSITGHPAKVELRPSPEAQPVPDIQPAPEFQLSPQPAALLVPHAPSDHWYSAWEKEDLVGIRQPVSNLARYICHQELVPPRAIGVFGDWGSGKSFFLRALRSEIALYADQSRTARETSNVTVFCGQVVQIEFNAWHYVESNLWASIAGHVFEQLYAELEQSTQPATGANELQALYQSLDLYKEAVAERERLEAGAQKAREQREVLASEVNEKRLSREQRARGLHAAVKTAIERAFENVPADSKQKLEDAAGATQIATAQQALSEANDVLREGQSTLGRARLVMQTWGPRAFLIAAALVVTTIVGVPLLVQQLVKAFLPSAAAWASTLGGYVVAGSAALTWLSGRAKSALSAAGNVLNILSDAAEQARSEERARLEDLDNQVAELGKQIATADAQVAEQQRRVAEARDAIDPRNLGTRLKRFIEERVRSKGYEEHLGLITLVRRDFEGLSKLMRQHWAQRLSKTPKIIIEADKVAGTPAKSAPFIERIVLYIDDLDRCPPSKVVEVLQAVHLMLGFPLFVVVVAVDVRWVRESLLKHYPDLLSNGATPSDVRAQADDYLEKIFQIPFRIPALGTETRERLLSGLLQEPYLPSSPENATGSDTVAALDLRPKELKLYPVEENAIRALHRSVGISPRRVRRFLDVYRIMRAGMDDGIVELITQTTNQHQVILGLFAMLSGAPSIAPRLLEMLYAELFASTNGAPITTGLADWLKRNGGNNADPANSDRYEREALTHACEYMDLALTDKAKLSQALVQWIPEVARYSFREIRLAT
jgi:hypothetical protein